MDLRTEMIKGQFDIYSDFLRVQTFIKQQKKEEIDGVMLKQMATTFHYIDRLRKLDVTINELNNTPRLSQKERHKRDMLLVVKTDLVRKIDEFNKCLQTGTHILTTDSELISVAEDLRKATYLFRKKVIKDDLEKSMKCAENS